MSLAQTVTMVVGDARNSSHRIIFEPLSKYLRTMLNSGFRKGQEAPCKRSSTQEEAADSTIGDTPEAFRALLRYLYTDELRFADEQLLEVMHKAKEISLHRFDSFTPRTTQARMLLSKARHTSLCVLTMLTTLARHTSLCVLTMLTTLCTKSLCTLPLSPARILRPIVTSSYLAPAPFW